ncbi:MAG: hypothetical protein HKN14_09265 [Marinicaulis sp.]|nr:MipA/OmpV family protein [Marinicaulis sp.]NNE41089.1 hypothetical protein [Marinicaulis sp.]NNL87855.1 hypothetical protein [Marinicaulis sp.]
MIGKRQQILLGTAGVSLLLSGSALAQQHADEPQLSPMLFGETEKERREKIQREREAQEEAQRISVEQSRDRQRLDEPRLRPLMFGSDADDAENEVGTRITLGEEDNNRGFFGGFRFLIPEETNLSLGVGPIYKPDYFGSDDYEFDADPQVFIRVRNFVFFDDDGADFALFGFSGFRIGPTLRIQSKRDQDDNPALAGLGDVGETFEFGAFGATTFANRFSFKAKARHGIKTGHRGTIVDGYLTMLLFRTDRLSLSATGQATWVGDKYADAYFSITPEQSARSGVLPIHDADAGFRDVGGSVTAYINIGDRWSLNPYATYSYIMNDISKSPIIDQFGDRNQFSVGFHLMRQFSFGGRR